MRSSCCACEPSSDGASYWISFFIFMLMGLMMMVVMLLFTASSSTSPNRWCVVLTLYHPCSLLNYLLHQTMIVPRAFDPELEDWLLPILGSAMISCWSRNHSCICYLSRVILGAFKKWCYSLRTLEARYNEAVEDGTDLCSHQGYKTVWLKEVLLEVLVI